MELIKAISFRLNTKMPQISNSLLEKFIEDAISRLYIGDSTIIKSPIMNGIAQAFGLLHLCMTKFLQLVKEEVNE